jgi:hypothetical protein
MDFPTSMNSGFDIRAGVEFLGACPVCKTNYDPWAIRLIAQQEEKHLLHVICQKCRVASLALVFVKNSEIKAIELVTDLNQEDIIRFGGLVPINANDILNLHQELGKL